MTQRVNIQAIAKTVSTCRRLLAQALAGSRKL